MEWKYILDEQGEPKRVTDPIEWARWFEGAYRSIALTVIGEVKISTVFIGLDHNFSGKGAPILWETMVFGAPKLAGYQRRYSSKQSALVGHNEAVAMVKDAIG